LFIFILLFYFIYFFTLIMSEDSSSSNVNPKPVPKPVRKLPKGMTNGTTDDIVKVKVVKVRARGTGTGTATEDVLLPVFKMSEYDRIHDKLSTAHLKHLCTTYGLKCSGTKPVLALRAHTHCMESHFISRIQRVCRGHFARVYIRRHVLLPECSSKTEYVNDTDFYTMDGFEDLPHYQIFTFKDETDHKLYRFNTASFFQLMKGAFTRSQLSSAASGVCCEVPESAVNPYTRTPISLSTVRLFFNKLHFCRIMRLPVYTHFKSDELTPQQATEARILEVFQDINKLGNYADSDWFSRLSHPQHIWFIQELYDIWAYRAELSAQVKMQICPPYGQIFPSVTNSILLMHEMRTAPFERVREVCISTCERLVRSGLTEDDRYLGASYVLSALTLVSPRAREALPWLYQSVAAGNITMATALAPAAGSGAGAGAGGIYTYNTYILPVPLVNNHETETYNYYTNNNANILMNLNNQIDDGILYNILMAMNNMNNNNNNTNN
jgi:hypothetical protein